jgi:hypothetical protein
VGLYRDGVIDVARGGVGTVTRDERDYAAGVDS